MNLDTYLDNSVSLTKSSGDKESVLNNANRKDRIVLLSTVDNPYDPLDNFNEWFAFDMQKGYNSCGYLARIVDYSNKFTDEELYANIEEAIDEIIKYDPIGLYIKVVKESK